MTIDIITRDSYRYITSARSYAHLKLHKMQKLPTFYVILISILYEVYYDRATQILKTTAALLTDFLVLVASASLSAFILTLDCPELPVNFSFSTDPPTHQPHIDLLLLACCTVHLSIYSVSEALLGYNDKTALIFRSHIWCLLFINLNFNKSCII